MTNTPVAPSLADGPAKNPATTPRRTAAALAGAAVLAQMFGYAELEV